MANNGKRFTSAGTDIEEVKRQIAQSNSSVSPATNPQKVREEIAQEIGAFNMNNASQGKTVAGTDIAEVKRQNAQSGLSYNAMMEALSIGTNPQKVREEISQEIGAFPASNNPSLSKTVAGTDIAEVKRQNAQSSQKGN